MLARHHLTMEDGPQLVWMMSKNPLQYEHLMSEESDGVGLLGHIFGWAGFKYALLFFLLFFSEKRYGENGSIVIYEANYRDQNTEHVTSNIKSPWQHRNQRHICNSTAVERQHESLLMSRVYPGRFLNSPLHDRGHFFLVQSINHPWYVTVQTQRSSI